MSKRDILRQIQALREQIFRHERKISDAQYEGGYTSSMERELDEFKRKVEELEQELNNYEWKFCTHHNGWTDFFNSRCEECGHQDW